MPGAGSPKREEMIAVLLAHSLLEEYYWRWFVFGRLARLLKKRWVPYVLASLGFAGHHYIVLGAFLPIWSAALLGSCVGLMGVVWCWLYRRQGSLAGCWISHLMADAAIVYVGYDLIGTA